MELYGMGCEGSKALCYWNWKLATSKAQLLKAQRQESAVASTGVK
jgi:hypothetical protein